MPTFVHVSVALSQTYGTLLVQERKSENYGKWNLPGGHLELGETLKQGAVREVAEETGLKAEISDLVGVYTSIRSPDYQAIRFVFSGRHTGVPVAGDEILAARWFSPEEAADLPDSALVGGGRLRVILADIASNRRYPLELLTEPT
jgi:ADP-ribose pyrophosphatase YjhB (NUDIX family)